MKKRILLAFLLSLPLVASCAPNATTPIRLTFGRLYDESLSFEESLEDIDVLEFADLIERGHNFLLLVYDPESTCTCYLTFQRTLEAFMEENNPLIYALTIDEYLKLENRHGVEARNGYETLAIFSNGSLVAQHQSGADNDPFTNDPEILEAWVESYADYSSMLYINKTQLDELLLGDDVFAVGYLRNSCPDCAFVEDHLLKDWNLEERNTTYVINCDVEGIRFTDGDYDPELWQSFKDEYGLSSAINQDYGYEEGYVPTFIAYNPVFSGLAANKIVDAATYQNDLIEEVNGKITITRSFYSEERLSLLQYLEISSVANPILEGLTLEENEVTRSSDGTIYLTDQTIERLYNPLLTSFLQLYSAK